MTTYVYPLSTYNVRCFHKYAKLELTSWIRYVHVMTLLRECTVLYKFWFLALNSVVKNKIQIPMTKVCVWSRIKLVLFKPHNFCPITGCEPLYAFDGSAKHLIPTLDLIHICCINEVWNSATYIKTREGKTLDLVHHFSKIPLDLVKQQAKQLWECADSEIQRHNRGTATYNARLFGVFLLKSPLTICLPALLLHGG